jgi:transcriptional regulator with XRE-family HTH domain
METKDILKELRKSKGFNNAKDFCEASGISYNTYQNYEAGKRMPPAETLIILADFYGVTTDYLLGREPPENAPNPLDSLGLNSLDKAIVQAYIALKPAERTQLVELLTKIADGAKPEITLIEPEKKRLPHSATIRELQEAASEDEAKNGA